MGQLRERLGERPVKFVFLATEHPGIPDIEILDKLLDVRSALLTQDRVLHNLAIGRGFQSFVHTPESGLTDRRLVHVSASDKHLPVASGALRDSYRHQSRPRSASHYGMPVQLPVRASIEAVSHEAPPYPCPFRLSRQYRGRCAYHRATAHHAGYGRRIRSESGRPPWRQKPLSRQRELFSRSGCQRAVASNVLGIGTSISASAASIRSPSTILTAQRWRGAPP